MSESRWAYMKISGHFWKCLNITGQLGKSLAVSENVWIPQKTSGSTVSTLYISETVWKPILALVITEWSSTYVLFVFFMDYIYEKRNRKEKII